MDWEVVSPLLTEQMDWSSPWTLERVRQWGLEQRQRGMQQQVRGPLEQRMAMVKLLQREMAMLLVRKANLQVQTLPWRRLSQRDLPEIQTVRRRVPAPGQRMGWLESEWHLNRAEDSLRQAWLPQMGCWRVKRKKRAKLAVDRHSLPRRSAKVIWLLEAAPCADPVEKRVFETELGRRGRSQKWAQKLDHCATHSRSVLAEVRSVARQEAHRRARVQEAVALPHHPQ